MRRRRTGAGVSTDSSVLPHRHRSPRIGNMISEPDAVSRPIQGVTLLSGKVAERIDEDTQSSHSAVKIEQHDIVESNAAQGSTPKGKGRHILFCFLPQFLFVLLALSFALGGGYWFLLPTAFLLVVVPLLDLLTGWKDDTHFNKNDFSTGEIFLLHWNTRLYALFYLGTVIYIAMSVR